MRSRAGMVGTSLMVALVAACTGEAAESASALPSAAAATSAGSASTQPSTAATPTEEPEPSEAAGPLTVTWEEPAPFDGQPAELMVDGETWVAVGWASERGPAAWTSSDGRVWSRADVPDPQPDDLFRGSGLGPTVRLGDSLLSFGTFIGCCDGRGVLGWRSADGTTWEVIESDSPLFEQGYLVRELTLGDPALVAVEIGYAEFSGRIWRWTEDTSWVETTPGAGGGEASGMQPNDVVWSDDRYVVVGTRGSTSDPTSYGGASWVSTDGETWQESEASVDLAGVRLESVAVVPGGGYAALGWAESPTSGEQVVPLAFTSSDGLEWTIVPGVFGDTRWLPRDLVAVDGGVVAFGMTGQATVVWTSTDGQAWTDAGAIGVDYQGGAAMGDQLVVFTNDFSSDEGWQVHRGTIQR